MRMKKKKNKNKNNNENNINNKDNEINEINNDDEKEALCSKKEKILSNFDMKVIDYCKEKNIILENEISGMTGEGVMQLFEDVIKLLFNDIENMEEDVKEFDISLSFYKSIEKDLNISSSGQSYHSNEYRKEINKINKKNSCCCCTRCSIF